VGAKKFPKMAELVLACGSTVSSLWFSLDSLAYRVLRLFLG
jgi:hypothetical protein